MRNLLISLVKDGKGSVLGYNILSYGGFKSKQAALKSIRKQDAASVLQKVKIENAVLDANGALKGTNGTLDRYPTFVETPSGTKASSCSLIVLSRVDGGFVLCNGAGAISVLTNRDAVAYSKMQGIANGKIVTKDGTEFISAIKGEYPYEDIGYKSEAEKGKQYSNEFYKILANAYGKNRAAIVKYLIEDKGIGTIESFVALIKLAPSSGIAMAGLAAISKDVISGKTDGKLETLVSKVVEPGVVGSIVAIAKKNIDFFTLWDADQYVPVDTEKKYDITKMTIEYKLTKLRDKKKK